MDGDGDLDVVLAFDGSSSVDLAIYMNQGDGSFQTSVSAPPVINGQPNSYPQAIDLVDADGDGDLDVAMIYLSDVEILTNDGSGGLSLPAIHQVDLTGIVKVLRAADLNGDGHPDVAAVDSTGRRIAEGRVSEPCVRLCFWPGPRGSTERFTHDVGARQAADRTHACWPVHWKHHGL